MHRATADWHRGTVLAVGVLVVVLIFPHLALLTLAGILAVVLIVGGIEMALSGITGVSRFFPVSAKPSTKSAT
jgi:hypothetical protein